MSDQRLIAATLCAAYLLTWSLGGFAIDGMTATAQVAAVILLIAATLWMTEAIPLFVTSLLVLALSLFWLEPVTRVGDVPIAPERFLAPFFSDIILLFLGGFVLSQGLRRFRLDEQFAAWLIRQMKGSPPRVLLGVIAATAFLSMWLSNTATTAMMLALVLPIIHGLPDRDPARKALALAVPLAANLGGLGTPVGSPPNAIAIEFLREAELAPSFLFWMVLGSPAVAGMGLATWYLLLRMFPPQTARIELPPVAEAAPATRRQVAMVVGGAFFTAIGWMTGPWHGYSGGTVALLPIVLYYGSGLLSVSDFRALPWDVLMLMGGGLCLGTVIADSGLAAWMVQQLPISGWSTFELALAFGLLACALSAVMSSTAAATLILPIALRIDVADPAPLAISVAFACSLAMPLPISTPPNAMAFASGEIRVSDLLRSGLTVTLAGMLLLYTTGFAWWRIVGLY